ncbi:MAG: peptide chain release factor N(5)-glutamine methyltransferase [Actinomycetaceae bacterium]|nr:peptide chain release factor N(5)-glutamine methyltransferase [Actinomycetaceae bacterium]
MIWYRVLEAASAQLAQAGVASPAVDARALAEHVCGTLPLPSEQPTAQQRARFTELVNRRAQREPLQHIIGTMWFRYLTLKSRPGGFIVRPETEIVVEAGLKELHALGKPEPVVVDLCTGSGAIALAIATEYVGARVFGVELDDAAFALAQENNAVYGSVVALVHGDARQAFPELIGSVDLVITNPPYVRFDEDLSPEVRQDPARALFGGGDDGLDLPRELVARAYHLLRPGGILIMEHGDDQGPALRAAASGYSGVYTGQDLTGRDRFLRAVKEA